MLRPYGITLTREELLRRYASGERTFGILDLCGVNLEGAVLDGVNLPRARFWGANLKGARFMRADLTGSSFYQANLDGAVFDHASLSQTHFAGASLRATRLVDCTLEGSHFCSQPHDFPKAADLTGLVAQRAWLRGCDFSGASLVGANLEYADLDHVGAIRTDFTDANMLGVNLRESNLEGAKLVRAQLQNAVLASASLCDADLSEAALHETNFAGASLARARFEQAQPSMSHLLDVDLGPLCRANLTHGSPSHVDFRSILRSLEEPKLKDFLRGAGMPDVFVEYMIDSARTLSQDVVFSLLQTTFISYGGPDTDFAAKLNQALQAQGVQTFFFRDHAPAGAKLHAVMWHGVNEHDRVILVCSRSSLERPGVLNEIEKTLAREARDGGKSYLIPVIIDDYLLSEWKPTEPDRKGMAQELKDRVAADFRQHADAVAFRDQVSRLISVLKKPGP